MRVKIEGLRTATKRLADGSRRVYAYVDGQPVATGSGATLEAANTDLAGALGRPETLAKIADMRARPLIVGPSRHYVGGVVEAFLGSKEFAAVDESTRRSYRHYLDAFRVKFRDDKLTLFDDPGIVEDLAEWRDANWPESPRAADYAIQSVGKLFKWAESRGWTKAQPTRAIGKLHRSNRSNRSDVIWTDGDLARFKAAAPVHVWRVVALAAETGMRQGDLLRLTWSAFGQRSIRLRTRKRGRVAVIPIREELQELIASIPRTSTHVLLTSAGQPWGSGFGASFQRARARAALGHLRFHDLRGTAATRLAEVLSDDDIAGMLGWSTGRVKDMLALYVSSDALADRLIAKLENSDGTANRLQTGSVASIADARKA